MKKEKVLEYSSLAFCDGKERRTLWADVWSLRACWVSEVEIERPGGEGREGHALLRATPATEQSQRACAHAFGSAHFISVATMLTRALASHWNRLQLTSWKWFVKKLTHPQTSLTVSSAAPTRTVRNRTFSSIYQEPNAHWITFISKFWLRGKTVVINLSQSELLKRKTNRFCSFCK